MSKEDFAIGQSKVEDFWKFINERHSIYLKRKEGLPRPWTDDPIFLDWKFTNVFRELDRGTIAIRQVLKELYDEYKESSSVLDFPYQTSSKRELIHRRGIVKSNYIRNQFITCILYRMFGHHENCVFGPITNTTAFYYFLRGQRETGKQIFTDAYMQPSVEGEDKLDSFERICRDIVSDADNVIQVMMGGDEIKLERAFYCLQRYNLIDLFTAYEFVCDLRYTDILRNATDTCTWCNIGPGAERGLKRLGLPTMLESIKELYDSTFKSLPDGDNHWIYNHVQFLGEFISNEGKVLSEGEKARYPYWELREIEHCLCEFDKYERIRLGQGRPRAKYNGRPENE